jgi:hypothetical protein
MSKRKPHKHEWTLLWGHFGRYGRQDAHVHQCMTCDELLVGEGRDCNRQQADHHTSPRADGEGEMT